LNHTVRRAAMQKSSHRLFRQCTLQGCSHTAQPDGEKTLL